MATIEPLDISKYHHKCRNRVYLVGVELEGGWNKLPQPDVSIVRDGSVVIEPQPLPTDQATRFLELSRKYQRGTIQESEIGEFQKLTRLMEKTRPKYVGEIPSPPLDYGEVEKWMKTFYPQHVNNTCGLHVHMSFRTILTYQRLMAASYQATIIAELLKWAKAEGLSKDNPLWDRLAGKSEYCQDKFWADDQVKTNRKDFDHNRPGHRYTHISFRWGEHQTIECRTLPMFVDPNQSIRAVKEVISITNAFLVADARREPKALADLRTEDNHFQEEMIECV